MENFVGISEPQVTHMERKDRQLQFSYIISFYLGL